MRILRVFPRATALTPDDDMAVVGDPSLLRPSADEVRISVTFTWDVAEAVRLAQAWEVYYPGKVRVGGPAFGAAGGAFVPGRYVREGVTFTSRGCNNRCPFCLVPQREGRLVELERIAPGYIVNDNNFVQCSPAHRRQVYAMLTKQPKAAVFSGGIQASLVTERVAAELRDIRIHELFLAADSDAALRPLERAVGRLSFLPRRKLRCYVLIGYGGETIEQAERRLERCWDAGVLPFAQLYQPAERWIEYPREWRALARKWSRPAAMVAAHKEAT